MYIRFHNGDDCTLEFVDKFHLTKLLAPKCSEYFDMYYDTCFLFMELDKHGLNFFVEATLSTNPTQMGEIAFGFFFGLTFGIILFKAENYESF